MRPATLEETVLTSSGETALPPASEHARGPIFPQRWPHLGLVLWVSLSMPIAGSAYYLFGGTAPTVPMQQDYRLVGGLITQVTSLTVLWDVMCRKGRRWKDIGWKLEFADIPRAAGLLIAAVVIMYLPVIPIQYFYRAYSGHFLARNSLHSIFGFGISFLSIAFICLNPFFEEPIVHAYTMSEVMSLGGSRELAVIVSVVAQMSYHLLSGTGECDGTDVPLHGVFNLLCTNPKNRAGDYGSPLSRSVQPHSRSILVGLEAEPHLDASSTQPFGK